jgi:LPS-assembly lipoprotein
MASASIQVAAENRPTAGMVTMTSNYRLVDTTTGDVISSGTRRVSASFDKPRQEFAAYRAERDAQDRAARELAELIRHAIAQDLAAAARG